MTLVENREAYDLCVARGFEPLFEKDFLDMPIALRVELTKEKFRTNQEYYRTAYTLHHTKCCEECNVGLPRYSATWVSHILSKGAHPEMRFDLRNFNLLCFKHHKQWENTATSGPMPMRKDMKILLGNEALIETLLTEYRAYNTIPKFD